MIVAYTRHGHHIPGTSKANEPITKSRCGGPEFCPACSTEAVKWIMMGSGPEREILIGDNDTNYQTRAMEIVRKWLTDEKKLEGLTYGLYIVWFAKTLQNWKALVGTTLKDGMYYEVTYNGDAHETYLDTYEKTNNIVYPD